MAIVGRDADLAELAALGEEAQRGRGAFALVIGEAGIGKTALCQQAAAEATDMYTVWAGCAEPSPAFGPWRQLIAQLPGSNRTLLGAADRRGQFESVVEFLRLAASSQPLWLTIDDFHIADAASIALAEFVAAQLRSMPAVLVATTRDEPTAKLRPHARVIRLGGLPEDSLGKLIAGKAGQEVDAATTRNVLRHTGGNPLFTRELVALLGPDGLRGALSGPAPAPVPETVRAVLAQRIDRLTAPCREAIAIASVIGEQPPLDLLGSVLPASREDVLVLLEEAVGAQVMRERGPGEFGFAHPLMRATAYSSIGLVRRIRLHQRIAELLPGSGGNNATLAYHYLAAAPGGTAEPAYRAAMAAAGEATEVLAYEQAAMHFGQALAAVSLDAAAGDRIAALLGLGQAQAAAGDVAPSRVTYLEAAALARKAGEPVRLAQAALGLAPGQGFEVALFDREQIALLEEAASTLDRAANPGLAAVVGARLSVALSLSGDSRRRESLSEEAVALARECGDARALAYALAAHCDDIAGPDDTERRLSESEEVIRLARGDDLHTELLGRRLRLVALLELGDLGAADREAADFASTARLLRQSTYDWYPALWHGMQALRQGRFAACERWIDEVRRIGAEAGSGNAELLADVQEMFLSVESAVDSGRHDRTARTLEKMSGYTQLGMQLQISVAYFQARMGMFGEAAASLVPVATVESMPSDSEWLAGMVQFAETAKLLGEKELLRWAGERLVPYRDRFVVEGIGAVVRGQVGSLVELPIAEAPVPLRENVFRREGDVWVLGFAGRTVRLRHAKGLADLARLIAHPGREIPALDLAVPATAAGTNAEGLHAAGDLGDLIDARAREAYKARLAELADAQDERSRAEREALIEQLAAAYGLGGRPRKAGDPAERARTAVTARLRAALDRIAEAHPDLGRHLRHSVHTGTLCRYEPEAPVNWQI